MRNSDHKGQRYEYQRVMPAAGCTYASVSTATLNAIRQKAIPLERQVRIAASAMVLLGAVLGVSVHHGQRISETTGNPRVTAARADDFARSWRSYLRKSRLKNDFDMRWPCSFHPYVLGLSAFVGAVMVFSGVIDTCGMGLLLARMPSNRVPPTACTNPSGQGV